MKMIFTVLSLAWVSIQTAHAIPQTCTVFYRGPVRYFETSGQWQSKIFLDQAVQGDSTCRGIRLGDFRISRVVLVGLSQYGNGQIYLAGPQQSLSPATTVGGDPERYRKEINLEQVSMFNADRNFRGPINIVMNGTFVVDRLILDLDDGMNSPPPPLPPPPPPHPPGPPSPPPHQEERILIGNFETGNPFKWDRDSITNPRPGGYFYAVDFVLSQGADVEIGEVRVMCRGNRLCFSQRTSGFVRERRPIRLNLRRSLQVESVIVESRPDNGFSIPPPKVRVYLVR